MPPGCCHQWGDALSVKDGGVVLSPYYSQLSLPGREIQGPALGISSEDSVEPRHLKGSAETCHMFERRQMKGLETSGYWSLARREVNSVAE